MPAKSKKQQRFMGMVHQCQKTGECPSEEIRKVADSMKKKDAKDFASTKHKGLPEKKRKKLKEGGYTFKNYLMERGYTEADISRLAKGALKKLAEIGKAGELPKEYKTPHDFFFDFYPDLPWEPVAGAKALKLLQKDPAFKQVAADWKEKLDFDLEEEIKFAIEDSESQAA